MGLAKSRAAPSNCGAGAQRVRGSLRATGTAPLIGIGMKAGYRQAFETTNQFYQFVRIKF